MDSIIQNVKECYVCGCKNDLHSHHIFYGIGKRKLSEQYGLKIWLCSKHHNMSDLGIHFNKPLDNMIKELAQVKAMNYYKWSMDDWMKIFRRNYT